jgi:CheY-like chemotaxis protein
VAILGVIGSSHEDREALRLLAGEAGHLAHSAPGLPETVELIRERRPRAIVLADEGGADAEKAVREILRMAPLMPVVVAQERRDASRAVALLRAGASEVVAAPWTKEDFAACLSKALRGQGPSLSLRAGPAARWGAPFYLFAVALFFAASFGALSVRRAAERREAEARKRTHWDMPYQHPSGLAFDGKRLWAIEWYSQSFFAHRREDGSVESVLHFPVDAPLAVSFAADSVWSVDAQGGVYRRMRDEKLTILQRYAGAAPSSDGVVFDGLYLWTCDAHQRIIRKHLVDDKLTVLATYPYAGGRPAALVYDGTALWSLDSANREILRHNLERPEEVTRRVSLGEYADGAYVPVGLTWDGTRFWTLGQRVPAEAGPARLFAHPPFVYER